MEKPEQWKSCYTNSRMYKGKFWTAIFRKLYDRIYDIHTEKAGCGIQALDAMTSWRANAVSGSMSHREVPGNLEIPNSHTAIYSHMPTFCVYIGHQYLYKYLWVVFSASPSVNE